MNSGKYAAYSGYLQSEQQVYLAETMSVSSADDLSIPLHQPHGQSQQDVAHWVDTHRFAFSHAPTPSVSGYTQPNPLPSSSASTTSSTGPALSTSQYSPRLVGSSVKTFPLPSSSSSISPQKGRG